MLLVVAIVIVGATVYKWACQGLEIRKERKKKKLDPKSPKGKIQRCKELEQEISNTLFVSTIQTPHLYEVSEAVKELRAIAVAEIKYNSGLDLIED